MQKHKSLGTRKAKHSIAASPRIKQSSQARVIVAYLAIDKEPSKLRLELARL